MIEDVIDFIENNTTYFLLKDVPDVIIGAGGKKSNLTPSLMESYIGPAVYEAKKTKFFHKAKTLIELMNMKKKVTEEKVQIIEEKGWFRTKKIERKIFEQKFYEVDLGEIYGKNEGGKAYVMVLATNAYDSGMVEKPMLYFVAIGNEETINEIVDYFKGSSYLVYLKALFPESKFPEAYDLLSKLRLEDAKVVKKENGVVYV